MEKFIDYTLQIKDFYSNFDISLEVIKIIDSHSVTRYFIKIDRTNKTKISNVEKLVDDLGVELNVKNIKFSIDFESGGVVLEIPKKERKTLFWDDLKAPAISPEGLQVCIGKDLNNKDFSIDLCKTPHLLVAGTTGSGKSMFINSILTSLLNTYKENYFELFLIDPKRVELNMYKNVEQVKGFADTLEDTKKILGNAILEIENRYKQFEKENCRNISTYNENGGKMPYRLIIIDELADIILQDKKNKLKNDLKGFESLENQIVRIAQIGRACGVHLIVATQRPSSDIITGLIKANIPSRVAFSVSSKVNSRIILDEKGAEKLTGKGDLLLKLSGYEELHRIQSPLVTSENIEKAIAKNRKHSNNIEPTQNIIEEPEPIEAPKKEKQFGSDTLKNWKRLEMAFNLFICLLPFIFIVGLLVAGYFKFALPILNT